MITSRATRRLDGAHARAVERDDGPLGVRRWDANPSWQDLRAKIYGGTQ